MISEADIRAALDVLAELVSSDLEAVPFEDLVALRSAASDLKSEAAEAIAAVETAMMGLVDGQPRQVGGSTFLVVDDVAERADHSRIEAAIIQQALQLSVDRDTGEFDARAAARAAAHLAMEVYVSPAKKPKKQALERLLDMDPKDVTSYDRKGKKLREID